MSDHRALLPRPAWLSPKDFPYRLRTAQVEDATLSYVDEGQGPTLLLIHGSPMWSFMYRHVIARLKDRYRCIAVDLPGLGLSRAPLRRGHAHEDATRYLQGFVHSLDLQQAVLAVHATAGPCALQMAVHERDRFAGLVISNSFGWPLRDSARLRFFVRLVSSRPFALLNVRLNALARITARFGRRGQPFSATERAAILGPYRDHTARRHLQNLLLGVRAEQPRFAQLDAELHHLAHLPTLLLYGAHDNGYRAGFVQRWQARLPRHQLHVLANAGHFPFEDEPQAATTVLDGWLTTSGATARPSFSATSVAS